jgi:tetratricopeptide (TPR) repeat protein
MSGLQELWRTSYFPVVLTLVIALSVLGLEVKLRQVAVDSVFVALLLIMAGALIAIRYLDDLMRRVSKIGPGGVELAPLSATDPAASRLLDEQILEWRSAINPAGDPFADRPLDARERWIYEGLSSRFMQLEQAHVEPLSLERAALERYRNIVFRLGYLALINKDTEKAYDVLKFFEFLSDARGDELFMLATAIAERADDNEDEAERTFAYRRAVKLLERAKAQDPTDAMIPYQLGWLYDELGRYASAIAENGRAAELDPEIAPSTFWNTAVSTLKTGDPGGAIAWLYRVPPGRIWREIAEDPELEPLHAWPGWLALLEEKLGEPPEHGAAG